MMAVTSENGVMSTHPVDQGRTTSPMYSRSCTGPRPCWLKLKPGLESFTSARRIPASWH